MWELLLTCNSTHLLTVLSIYSELPASSCLVASHCNVHSLSSHPVSNNAQELVSEYPRTWEHHFLAVGWDLNFIFFLFWQRMLGVSILHSCVRSVAYNGGSIFHYQWQYSAERRHLAHDTGSEGGYRYPNGHVCAIPWMHLL